MTTVKHSYNPLSIEQQVRNRLEKKMNGLLPREADPLAPTLNNRHAQCDMNSSEENQHDLSTQFLDLLFSAGNQNNSLPNCLEKTGSENHLLSSSKKTGTNNIFSPHKEQEESTKAAKKEEQQDFSLQIESTELGELTVKGEWANGNLKVVLHMPQKLDLQQRKVLVAILEKKLSHELGVKTEIEID